MSRLNYSEISKIKQLDPLEVYTCYVDLGSLKKKYIDIINYEGDKQSHLTNIKANMTEWNLNTKYKDFHVVSELFLDVYKKIMEIYHPQFYQNLIDYYHTDVNLVSVEIWGAKYKSKEKTIPHCHDPAIMSMCLYLKTPKGCPGLSFTDISKTIPVEENQMVIFDPFITHSVKSKKFRGERYVLAANLKKYQ
jgi:hypothetical protein